MHRDPILSRQISGSVHNKTAWYLVRSIYIGRSDTGVLANTEHFSAWKKELYRDPRGRRSRASKSRDLGRLMAAFGRLVPGAWPGWHSARGGVCGPPQRLIWTPHELAPGGEGGGRARASASRELEGRGVPVISTTPYGDVHPPHQATCTCPLPLYGVLRSCARHTKVSMTLGLCIVKGLPR